MSIVKDGEYLAKEIFDGRNSEWFNNLRQRGYSDDIYDSLPVEYGVYPKAPEEVHKDSEENYYYDFRYIKVKDMFNWLRKMEPWIDAGWASSYEKWLYEKCGKTPEDGFPHYKPEEENEPYYFIEYEKRYDCSKWLYKYIRDRYDKDKKDEYKNIPEDEYLIYYFDC